MTRSERDWELLQREVDRENSSDASAALRERLAREPELVAHYQALDGVTDALRRVRLVEPPPELVRDVMSQVRQRAFGRRPRVVAGVFGRLATRPVLTLASTVAAGLVVGVLATSLTDRLRTGHIDESAVRGTVMPSTSLDGLRVIEEIEIGGPGMGATLVTRQQSDVVVAEIRIRGPRPLDVTVELDARALRPRGFESLDDLPTGAVALEEGLVRVRQAPAGRYLLTLAVLGPDPAPLRIRLEAGETTLEGQLRAAAPQ